MKKLISLALCLALCAGLLSACSSPLAVKKTALSVGKAEVDKEVFAYYFDRVYNEAEDAGDNLLDTAALTDKALEYCYEYVAATTMFESLTLRLDTNSRKAIADNTESQWLLYGSYYTDAGISKQTLAKIFTVDQYRTALLLYYFGEGSEYEVTESEIERYFDQTYVAFQAINGYLTTTDENGASVELSQADADALRTTFENKRQLMEAGSAIAEVNDGNDVNSTFIAVSNSAYPQGFLQKVAALEYNKPTVIETDDYIFLVVRLDAKQGDNNYYDNYRTHYIEALRGEMLTEMLIATADEYDVTKQDKVLSKAAAAVVSAHNSRK